jgi:hypothetical protein
MGQSVDLVIILVAFSIAFTAGMGVYAFMLVKKKLK